MEGNRQEALSDADYIAALENSLIFMCDFYEGLVGTVFEQFRKTRDDELVSQLPTIQGTPNTIAIKRIADIGFDRSPKHGFPHIYRELVRRRGISE